MSMSAKTSLNGRLVFEPLLVSYGMIVYRCRGRPAAAVPSYVKESARLITTVQEGDKHDPEVSHPRATVLGERSMLGPPEHRHRSGARESLRDCDRDCHLGGAWGGLVMGQGDPD